MRSLARMPWQDRIVEAAERIDHVGGLGLGNRTADDLAAKKQDIFIHAQIPGTIVMTDGGGAAKPVSILIETENGWLVRVTLPSQLARAFGELLINSCGSS